MTHKQALINIIRILEKVPPINMGCSNEDIWLVLEALGDKDVVYNIQTYKGQDGNDNKGQECSISVEGKETSSS